MEKKISFTVDSDIYEKFCLALNLTNESEDADIETCMRWYIAKSFEKASQEYNPKAANRANESKDYYGKAIQRIPIWSLKPTQYNHKIIRAYFEAVDIAGEATLTMMERLCSNKDHPELYVPTFKNNYSQMKMEKFLKMMVKEYGFGVRLRQSYCSTKIAFTRDRSKHERIN